MTDHISVNKQSSIRIGGRKVLYFDPLSIRENAQDADVIFITHDHGDHFSPSDIKKVAKADTKLVAPEAMQQRVLRDSGIPETHITFVRPGQVMDLSDSEGYLIETIPAYNTTKQYHPKSSGWCGYIVEMDDVRYYVAGDMDDTEDARKVRCDVALIPIGGTFTMNAREAAGFVNAIKPKVVIPTHYGSIVGSPEDGETFKKFVEEGIRVEFRL